MDRKLGRARVLTLMKSGAAVNARRASREAFLSERQARTVLKELHDEEKLIYISSWYRDQKNHRWGAVFRLGDFPDAPKPRPLTEAEKSERYRYRLSKDEMRGDFMRNVRCARRRITKPDRLAMRILPWLYAPQAQPNNELRARVELQAELEAA